MIAIDTNILLRYIVRDDEAQAAAARALLEETLTVDDPGFVSLVVLVELCWTLGRFYSVSTVEQTAVLRRLLAGPQLVVEQAEGVEQALRQSHGDVADLLIHAVGRRNGCTSTVTFDRKFARLDGVELLETSERSRIG